MNQNKRDKIQIQKKIQSLYRKRKQEGREELEDMDFMYDYNDIDDNNIGRIIIRICVVLGILVLVLDAIIKEF